MIRPLLLAAGLAAATAGAAFAQTDTVPKGTEFEARLNQELSTKRLHDGDTFTMTQHDGFFHKAPPILKGATIDGHVENVSRAKMGHGATMNVILDDIKLADGRTLPLDATVTSSKAFEAKHHYLRDTGLVIGGAVAGHIASKRSGVKHGTVAGAAAGFALATNLKSDIDVKRGTVVHLKLNAPLSDQSA